jgi:hypothetical protein
MELGDSAMYIRHFASQRNMQRERHERRIVMPVEGSS